VIYVGDIDHINNTWFYGGQRALSLSFCGCWASCCSTSSDCNPGPVVDISHGLFNSRLVSRSGISSSDEFLVGVWHKTSKTDFHWEYLCLDSHRPNQTPSIDKHYCHNLLAQSPARLVSGNPLLHQQLNYNSTMSKKQCKKTDYGHNLRGLRRGLGASRPSLVMSLLIRVALWRWSADFVGTQVKQLLDQLRNQVTIAPVCLVAYLARHLGLQRASEDNPASSLRLVSSHKLLLVAATTQPTLFLVILSQSIYVCMLVRRLSPLQSGRQPADTVAYGQTAGVRNIFPSAMCGCHCLPVMIYHRHEDILPTSM